MKKSKTRLTAVCVVLSILAAGLNAAEAGTPEYVPGELIVKLEHGVIDWQGFEETPFTEVQVHHPQLRSILEEYQVRSIERLFKSIFARPPFTYIRKDGREVQLKDLSQVYIFRMDERLDMEQVAEQVEQLPGVVYAEPNYIAHCFTGFPSDPDFKYEDEYHPYQWGLYNRYSDPNGWDINALKAWSIETGEREVLLAILDSGLEDDHYDESDDEFYGRVSYDTNLTDGPLDEEHEHSHGTHVTGIAAAATNSGYGEGGVHGIAGVAGGWSQQEGVDLAIAKISRFGGVSNSDMADAIEWATDKGAEVLNCSYGGSGFSKGVAEAIDNAFSTDMTLFFAQGTPLLCLRTR